MVTHMRNCGELKLFLWALGTQGLKNFALCFSLSLAGRQLAYLPMTGRGGLRSLETFAPTIATKAWQFTQRLYPCCYRNSPFPQPSVWSYCISADSDGRSPHEHLTLPVQGLPLSVKPSCQSLQSCFLTLM